MLLQFYGYHKIKQEESKGTSFKRESYILVVEDVEKWWKKRGISLKSRDAIICMVKKLTERYENLEKHKNRGKEKENRENFFTLLISMLPIVWAKCRNLTSGSKIRIRKFGI